MKKILFLVVLIPALSFAQANTKAQSLKKREAMKTSANKMQDDGFVISGNITGLADGVVKITTTQGDSLIATSVSKNGIFTLSGKLPESSLYWLTLSNEQPQYIFLDNAKIQVTGKQADIKKIRIDGSQSHKDFLSFQEIFNPLFGNINAIAADIQQATEDKKQAIMQRYSEALEKLNTAVGSFVSARKKSPVSVFVLTITKQVSENVLDLEERYAMLDATVKTSAMAKDLENYIAFAKVGSIGSPAIEFIQNDVNDQPIALSSFKGKYVLIDFWASWCKPCRIENPNVVKVFNKFKDRNFTVLGVSLDQQKEAWLKAIEKDNLKWTHVSDLQLWNNAAAQLYRVQSIPQNFLIDPNGKIVAKDLRGEDLEKKLCQFLGCSN